MSWVFKHILGLDICKEIDNIRWMMLIRKKRNENHPMFEEMEKFFIEYEDRFNWRSLNSKESYPCYYHWGYRMRHDGSTPIYYFFLPRRYLFSIPADVLSGFDFDSRDTKRKKLY